MSLALSSRSAASATPEPWLHQLARIEHPFDARLSPALRKRVWAFLARGASTQGEKTCRQNDCGLHEFTPSLHDDA